MKKLFFISFFILLLAAFLFSPTIMAAEKTVYIDQTKGNDAYDGSVSNPLQSISKALESCSEESDDDLTIILDHQYQLSDTSPDFSGPLKADGTPRVTIKPTSSGCFTVERNQNPEITFTNIHFDGAQNNERTNPVFIVKSGTLTFDHVGFNAIHENYQGSNYFQMEDGSLAHVLSGASLKIQNSSTVNYCQGKNGIFHIDSGGTMTILGNINQPIIFSNCQSDLGGVINNVGSLSIDYTIFQNNAADQYGGAIYNSGSLSVNHGTFKYNTADHSGGALYNIGSSTINNTLYFENKVTKDQNIALHGGGAIFNAFTNSYKEISIIMSHCQFKNNSSLFYGGAVKNAGSLTADNISFENNTAQNGNALYISSQKIGATEKSIVNLSDCTTAKDQSILTDSNKLTFSGGTYEGSIHLGKKVTYLTVKKDVFSKNTLISDLQLINSDTEQYIKYGGGFSKDCRINFFKLDEDIAKPLEIVQGQFNNNDEINAFHLNDDQYRLEIVNKQTNNDLKAMPKVENSDKPQSTINFTEETIGVDNTMQWKTNGESSAWHPCQKDMPLSDFGWDGSNEVVISVRYAATSDRKPSGAISITIPARPAAPTGLTPHDESTYGAGDGSVEGVSDNMQYRTVGDDGRTFGEWTDVETNDGFDSSSGRLGSLAPGNYQFRIKAGEDSFASPPGEILKINAGARPIKPAVKPLPDLKKQINYTDESITVTKGMHYRDGNGKWLPCEGTMPLETFGWDGSVEVTVTFRDQDGRKNTVTIPPRAAAIENGTLNVVDETVYGQGGEITGVNENMEYRPLPDITTESEGEGWIDCAASPHFDKASGALKNIPAGDYQFRTKASVGHFAGMPATVTIHSASLPIPQVAYRVHGKNYGWSQGEKISGETAGTTGECLRLEAITLKILSDNEATQNLSAAYRVHMADIGWSDFVKDGETAGTTGECRRLEAFEAKLTGEHADQYNLWYRVHAKDIGWMPWVKNGETAGTTGECRRIEAIEIKILAADDNPPGIN